MIEITTQSLILLNGPTSNAEELSLKELLKKMERYCTTQLRN